MVLIKVHSFAMPMRSHGLHWALCIFKKPDDGRTRPKHVACLTSCRFATVICMLCKDGSI